MLRRLAPVPALILAVTTSLAAQQRPAADTGARDTTPVDLSAPVPADPTVEVGTLPNGIRFYIRVNHRPEQRAELRLVVNAGSILEDSTQLGLAHFVEHMCFDGTTKFPKHQLIDYLESTGVRFGADLNASTSFDETIYELTVPTDSAHLFETGFDVLAEWAHNVTFDQAELDRERKVVIEEWRLGRGASSRIRDKQFPILFKGSRYAERLPIGTLKSLQTATRAELVRFYRDWYRPDLMAVVAVGDFDKAKVARLIRERFSSIPPLAHQRPRTIYPVPDHTTPLASVVTDPEATNSRVTTYWLEPVRAQRTVGDYRSHLVQTLYDAMFNSRLSEIAQRPGAPFIGAGSSEGRLVRSKDAYIVGAVVRDSGITRGLSATLTEAQRVAQHGFVATELAREKSELLREMEQAYAERAKTSSDAFVSQYIDNYLEAEPIPSAEQEYQLARRLLPGITLSEVNALVEERLGVKNPVVLASAPAKAGVPVPGDSALVALVTSTKSEQVATYVDSASDQPLIPTPPTPGRITATKTYPSIGVTEWRLSNGARVLLKPTDFKDDELLVRAYSPGGTSIAPDSLYIQALGSVSAVAVGGIGNFSANGLEKALAGKSVSASPFIGTYEEGLSGGGSPQDAETLFQLIHLYFTAPRADSGAFEAYRSRMEAALANRSASPAAAFADTLQVTLAQHNMRARPLTSAVYDSLSLPSALSFYRQRFANAGDFTFILVGNIDTARVRQLVERYIASLPSTSNRDVPHDVGLRYPDSVVRRDVYRGLEPKSQTGIVFTGPFTFTRENVHMLSSLSDVLEIVLRDRLRQALGGTYGVGVQVAPRRFPRQTYEVRIGFGSAPERVQELRQAVFAEIDSLQRRGPSDADVQKVRETQLRERETDLRRNDVWLSLLYTYDVNQWDPAGILAYPAEVNQLTSAGLRDAARTYLDRRRFVEVTLYPQQTGDRDSR